MNYLLSVVLHHWPSNPLPALCRLTIHQNGPFSASLTGLICVCEHCMEIVNCRGTNYFQFPTCQLCGSAILCFQDGNTRRAKDARCIESTFRYSHRAIPQSGSGTRRRIPDFEERELHFTGRNEKRFASLDRMKYREKWWVIDVGGGNLRVMFC